MTSRLFGSDSFSAAFYDLSKRCAILGPIVSEYTLSTFRLLTPSASGLILVPLVCL